MITTIVRIGNSQGIRIPKPLIEASGIGEKVELKVKKGEIKIVPVRNKDSTNIETALLSEKSLSDWNNKAEDMAWEKLQ